MTRIHTRFVVTSYRYSALLILTGATLIGADYLSTATDHTATSVGAMFATTGSFIGAARVAYSILVSIVVDMTDGVDTRSE